MTETDHTQPLPSSVSEYTIESPGTTPTIMYELGLDRQYRAQFESNCAVTRYTLFGGEDGCEISDSMNLTTLEWTDVADWDVPANSIPPTEE